MTDLVLSVSQLNTYVKGIIESDPLMRSVYVVGEISNFVDHYKSGHFYLSLKDSSAAVKAVMFRMYAQRVKFKPFDGMKVICRGRVSLFERDGSYQLYIEDMQPDGVGALKLAFDQLVEKLRLEGLFDEGKKKPIPPHPAKIAVITSPTGAAVQDIISVIGRRMSAAELIMCPVLVQGDGAAASLRHAVDEVNALDCADVIIIGRGGGSMEDLWAFNDEALARAIFNSKIPVISAVGHETDFTICDFVADLRAPTPSAAAELAVESTDSVLARLAQLEKLATRAVDNIMKIQAERLKSVENSPLLKSPQAYVDGLYERFDSVCGALAAAGKAVLDTSAGQLALTAAKLDAYSPLKTLSRGYSIAARGSRVVRSVDELRTGDRIDVRLSDGIAACTVNSTERK